MSKYFDQEYVEDIFQPVRAKSIGVFGPNKHKSNKSPTLLWPILTYTHTKLHAYTQLFISDLQYSDWFVFLEKRVLYVLKTYAVHVFLGESIE